jgi:transcriptional regulator with GAF, ATPase, and Fis domain
MAPPPQGFDAVTKQLLTESASGARVAFRRRPRVTWTDARGAQSSVIEQRMVVGSAPEVDLVIADPTVSRLHAELDPREDGLWVRDLGSRNGTIVDGIQVLGARVPEGGVIRLGGTRLAVSSPDEPVAVDLWPDEQFGQLRGRSAVMRELFARLAKVAALDAPVLLQGETGTGKELAARALHDASPRADRPFIIVDCGALPENLLEAELFGHARGAFTGAVASRAGAFEVGHEGTVFLDEIGELPLAMQPKLLRVLESQTVRRLGETQHRSVNFRLISATNRNLRELVNVGAFREDLYFRLAVVPVTVPPLRAHVEDIPLLVEQFRAGRGDHVASEETLRQLAQRPWLGNVRELRNFVEQALAFGAREALALLPGAAADRSGPAAALPPVPLDRPFKDVREEWMNHLERQYVSGLLERHAGNVTAVAEAAGLDRTYVHRLIKKHDL